MGPGRPPRVHCAPGFEQMYMCMLHKLCWILFSISFQLARFQCWGSWVFFCPGRASARLHAPLWGFRCFKFVDFRHISMAEIGLLGAGLRLHSGSFSTQCISIYIVDRSIIEISDCVKFNQFGWVFRFVVLFWCRLGCTMLDGHVNLICNDGHVHSFSFGFRRMLTCDFMMIKRDSFCLAQWCLQVLRALPAETMVDGLPRVTSCWSRARAGLGCSRSWRISDGDQRHGQWIRIWGEW